MVIAQGRLSWLPSVAIWTDFEIFEIPGEAGDTLFLPSTVIYPDKVIYSPLEVGKEEI